MTTDNRAILHHLVRTSAVGQPFRGRCILCGADDLPATDALEPCPNPHRVSCEDALLDAIFPKSGTDEGRADDAE